MKAESTNYKDDNGIEIFVGDKLKSTYGYSVIVYKESDNDYSGMLVCKDNHSCKSIPYSLNKGKGYKKIDHGKE